MKTKRVDMHAHLCGWFSVREELEVRKEQGILTCFSAGTPKEWQVMEPWKDREELRISFGVHPWYADQYPVKSCRDYLWACDFIGEIGMDSVWCQVPRSLQQKALEQQLQAAADLKKPVLLHTKGEEKRIGEMIQDFPGAVCVHWYSGNKRDLESYLRKGCYFTLGPDVSSVCRKMEMRNGPSDLKKTEMEKAESYLCLLNEVPVNRILLETDGLSAIAWAEGVKELPLSWIVSTLEKNERYLSQRKGLTSEELQRQFQKNLEEFLCS